jgi:hypothetical protein
MQAKLPTFASLVSLSRTLFLWPFNKHAVPVTKKNGICHAAGYSTNVKKLPVPADALAPVLTGCYRETPYYTVHR